VFGLRGGIFTQYIHYMNELFVHHTMGPSLISYPTSAQDIIGRAIPYTIGLLGIATVISFVLGLAAGAVVGWKPMKRWSSWTTDIAIALSHVPFYFLALIGLFFLSYHYSILPSLYAYGLNDKVGFNGAFISSLIDHGILPALSIVIVGVAGQLISVRQLMIPVIGEDYLNFAEAKGLKPRRILRTYALRNCYLPAMTGFGISLGYIFSGNILIEQLFDYPGVGHLYVQAIQELDYDTALGITMIGIFTVLTANLIIDFLLPLFDPRVKFSK
jgi:peptide/nickel transport system permease protein